MITGNGVVLKDASGKDYVGKTWAGDCVFPDFLHFNCESFWRDQLYHLYLKMNFTGAWLNMN